MSGDGKARSTVQPAWLTGDGGSESSATGSSASKSSTSTAAPQVKSESSQPKFEPKKPMFVPKVPVKKEAPVSSAVNTG